MLYAWGRGFSQERKVDVSRFKPKSIDSLENTHAFLIPAQIDSVRNLQAGGVINLKSDMVNQLHPKMRLSEKSPKNHIEQTFTNAYSSDKMSAYTNSENVFRC